MACFYDPVSISVTRASILIYGHDLCFCCDVIKAFFDAITECRANVVGKLLDILQEHNVDDI